MPAYTRNLCKLGTDNKSGERDGNILIGYLNAQSCRNKTDDIVDLIQEKEFDLLFITETWLTPSGDEVTIKDLTPTQYILKSCPRPNRRGGGIALIYRNNFAPMISFKSEPSFDHTTFEVMELALDLGWKHFRFVCLYRPPYSKANRCSSSVFITEFENLLSSINSRRSLPVLLGDFNFHFESPSSEVKQLKHVLSQCNMSQLITSPTHRAGHIIDWVITRTDSGTLNVNSVENKLISDHFIISMVLDGTKPKTQVQCVTSRNIKAINVDTLKNDIVSSLRDLDSLHVDSFNNTLKTVLDKHAPLVSRRLPRRPYAPWFTAEVKAARRERRKAERKWRKTGLSIDMDIYKSQRQQWKKTIRFARADYYAKKFSTYTSSKQFFGICNDLLGKSNESPLPVVHTEDELPDKFASFFVEKVQHLREDLDSFQTCNSFDAFEGNVFCQFHVVSEEDVRQIIMKSDIKCCALDPIPASLFSSCLNELLPFITTIINDSLVNGSVPESFKFAIVKPLLKKPSLDQNVLKNYRPVSNLPFISKILEKIVLKQLKQHLQANTLFEPFQSAYREHHSTETAVLKVLNDILVNVDSGSVALLSLLDLSAAFDTIDHKILLKRLSITFGISDTVLRWFESYLTNRYQSIVINGKMSVKHVLPFGVPQGSVLGPVLFTMYTQPLAKIIQDHGLRYHMYADDTQLYSSVHPCHLEQLVSVFENCITSVKEWMNMNKLILNDDKTEVVLTGSARALNNIHVQSIVVGDSIIPFSKKAKNLGVYFDADLSMNVQVNHLIRCMYMEIKNVGKIRHLLSQEHTAVLINSLVLSKLDYCNSLLAELPADKIGKLQIAQNNAARLVLKKSKRDSATPLLKKLHWLPVRKRILYKLATLCHRCVNGKAPIYLSNLLTPYVPSRQLRSSADTTKLRLPKIKLKTFGERSFEFAGPRIWNSIPQSLREIKEFVQFKKHLKTYLFSQ